MKHQYLVTYEQIVDVLTKPLSTVTFEYFKDKLRVSNINVPRKRE